MGMQTDVLGSDVVYQAGLCAGQIDTKRGAGILKKTLTRATKSYQPKYTKPVKPFREREEGNFIPATKPIKEGDLN